MRIAKLDRVILDIETRVIVAAVDVLKAVGLPLVRLQQKAKTGFASAAIGRVNAVGGILARLGDDIARHLSGDRRRHHVEGAADGVGPLGNRSGPLNDLDRAESAHGREIIGRGRGVGRGCDEHIVF